MAQLIPLKILRLQNVGTEITCVNRGAQGFELELLSMLAEKEVAKK